MAYMANDYAKLIGMAGFSEALLKNHFTLYQGYVTNTNKVLEILEQTLKNDRTATPEFAELKRRLGWEFNGMRLHEYYFDNLGGTATHDVGINLGKKLAKNFGSIDAWERDFRTTGAMRGIGWAVLYQDSENGGLINFWINEHDAGHPAGCKPLLVMDVFEKSLYIVGPFQPVIEHESMFKDIHDQYRHATRRVPLVVLVDPEIDEPAVC